MGVPRDGVQSGGYPATPAISRRPVNTESFWRIPPVEGLESHVQTCVAENELAETECLHLRCRKENRQTYRSRTSRRQIAGSVWRELARERLRVLEG